MNCPLCLDRTLEPLYRHGIEIDRCPNCRGLWLDRGEIEKLVEAAASAPPPPRIPPAPSRQAVASGRPDRPDPPSDRSRDKGKKNKKKRKSRLSDLIGEAIEEVLDL